MNAEWWSQAWTCIEVPLPEQDLFADASRIRAELDYVEKVGRSEGPRRAIDWELDQQRDEPSPDYRAVGEPLSSLAKAASGWDVLPRCTSCRSDTSIAVHLAKALPPVRVAERPVELALGLGVRRATRLGSHQDGKVAAEQPGHPDGYVTRRLGSERVGQNG